MEKQRQHEGVGRDGVKEGSESGDFRAELCIPSDTSHGDSSRMLLELDSGQTVTSKFIKLIA